LVVNQPKIIHACDFDTASLSYVYKALFRKKLIFDIFDRYAMTFIPKNFKLIYSTINYFEEFLCRRSDAVILVGKNILNTFKKIPKCIFIIANYPEAYSVNIKKSDDSKLRLFYIGYISKHRGIERIIDAIKNLDSVEFVIVGRIIDREFFNQISTIPNVKYKGELSHQEASTEEANSDAMVVLYDLQVKGNALAYPNKTYEAMMFKMPLITNMLPELITETDCGIIVDYNNLNQIKNAIINLRDNKELRERLGANGRRAFEQRCNWNLMEQELYKIYDRLLGN
jgi:glycosyltransferase involved in cell wall biosynthesis